MIKFNDVIDGIEKTNRQSFEYSEKMNLIADVEKPEYIESQKSIETVAKFDLDLMVTKKLGGMHSKEYKEFFKNLYENTKKISK
jgi:hypothetical protein